MNRAKKDAPPRFPEFRGAFLELMGDMTLEQFAKKLGMSRATVGFYAAGQRIPDALGLKKHWTSNLFFNLLSRRSLQSRP